MCVEALHERAAGTPARVGSALRWSNWQAGVVRALQIELHDVAPTIALTDVDWPAWRSLFEAGHGPYAAVLRALERDY